MTRGARLGPVSTLLRMLLDLRQAALQRVQREAALLFVDGGEATEGSSARGFVHFFLLGICPS
jgi:hypothetical protein